VPGAKKSSTQDGLTVASLEARIDRLLAQVEQAYDDLDQVSDEVEPTASKGIPWLPLRDWRMTSSNNAASITASSSLPGSGLPAPRGVNPFREPGTWRQTRVFCNKNPSTDVPRSGAVRPPGRVDRRPLYGLATRSGIVG
jgi:hypothetical protein